MGLHEIINCARCELTFECKVGSITQCQCYGIILTEEMQQYINKQFAGCLCLSCIKNLRQQLNAGKLKYFNQ